MGKSSAGMVILGIIAVAGLGLSGYMFINNEILAPPDNQNIVVGFWDNLNENMDFDPHTYNYDFLIQFLGQKIINNNYIKLSNSDTTFTFLKQGMYKVTCSIDLSNIAEENYYYINLWENANRIAIIFNFYTPTGSGAFFHLTSSIYIFANLSSEYRIQAYSSNHNDFSIIDTGSNSNQLIIEYISL